MTRFGVMKHLGVLEDADLVTTRRVGREKRHYLNPVPIRLAHDRWISKYAAPIVGSMSFMKRTLEAPMETIDHVYSVYIKASPERVWQAITDGDETVRYYFGTRVRSTWEVGAPIDYDYPDGSPSRPMAWSSRSSPAVASSWCSTRAGTPASRPMARSA